jgi:hypothetical protein
MFRRSLLLAIMAAVVGLVVPGRAEEKNGLQVTVQKVTLDRADVRGPDVNIENYDRLMGLRVTIRNVGFKELPECEVTWEILKRKYDNGAIELTTGTDKLQRLKGGETVEVNMGIARTGGVRNGALLRRDDLDWELIFRDGSREIARFSSKSNFAMLLKRAVKVEAPAAPAPAVPAAGETAKP